MLFEAFPITPGIRDILAGSDGCLNNDAVIKSAMLDGMIPIRKKGLELVDKGQTTVDQLLHFAV